MPIIFLLFFLISITSALPAAPAFLEDSTPPLEAHAPNSTTTISERGAYPHHAPYIWQHNDPICFGPRVGPPIMIGRHCEPFSLVLSAFSIDWTMAVPSNSHVDIFTDAQCRTKPVKIQHGAGLCYYQRDVKAVQFLIPRIV